MPKGTKIQDKEAKLIVADYIQGHSMGFLANKYGRSKSSIKRVVDRSTNGEEQMEQFRNAVEQVKQDNTKEILGSITDNKTYEIISKYKNALSKDATIKDALSGKAKIQPLANTVGMLVDKIIKLEDLMLRKESLQHNIKLNETFDPTNDNFKKAAIQALQSFNIKDADKYIEPESKDNV